MAIKLWTDGSPLTGAEHNDNLTFLDESKADLSVVVALQEQVADLPTGTELAAVAATAAGKADQADVDDLAAEVAGKLTGTAADAAAVAQGTATSFPTVQAMRFWEQQTEQSSTDVDPTTGRVSLDLSGAEHSLNVLVPDVEAPLSFQIGAIALGLAGSEGRIVFENGSASAQAVTATDHEDGATIRFGDDAAAPALTVPAGIGSRLTVFFEIVDDGAAGKVEITRLRTFSADGAAGTAGLTGAVIAGMLADYLGPSWRPAPINEWVVVVGEDDTDYGYSRGGFGALYDGFLSPGLSVEALIGISPNIVHLRVTDLSGNNVQQPGVTSLRVTMRDILSASEAVVLTWNEATARYENTSAADAYDFLADRQGETLTLTGLNEQYEDSTLRINGSIPTAMTVGQSYEITPTASGGVAPLTFSLVGTWPTASTIDATTGVVTVAPTSAASFSGLSIRVTDSAGASADLATTTIVVSAATALSLTGTPVTTGTQGLPYAGFVVTAAGGTGPYTFATTGTYPPGMAATKTSDTTASVGGTPGASGSFTGLNVQVTDALGATAVLSSTYSLTIASSGGAVAYTSLTGGDPALPPHRPGDRLVYVMPRTNTHGGVAPSLTVDANNPWEIWDDIIEGTDRAMVVYRMIATRSDHTATSTNASGRRSAWRFRGKDFDTISLATFADSTSVTIPGL